MYEFDDEDCAWHKLHHIVMKQFFWRFVPCRGVGDVILFISRRRACGENMRFSMYIRRIHDV